MTKGRDNAAESLSDVLELIRVRRQSGLLSVECIQSGRFEEGDIYFQAGQPVYARSGSLAGNEALNRLLSWRQVYFSFSIDQPRPSVNIPAQTNPRGVARATTDPLSTSVNPFADTNPIPNAGSRRIERTERTTGPQAPIASGVGAGAGADIPGLEWLVPQKRGNERDVLSLPLTRPQRSIYLLIDGKRTVADLSRCTRKNMQEIERLLSELQERGLIMI